MEKQIINYNNSNAEFKQFIINEGKQIYDNNNFFKDLHNLMSNKEFKIFYDKYFNNWLDTEVMIMYMKLYDKIKQTYEIKYNKQIDKNSILFMIREIIRNNEYRKYVIDNFELFKEGLDNRINIKKNKYLKKI